MDKKLLLNVMENIIDGKAINDLEIYYFAKSIDKIISTAIETYEKQLKETLPDGKTQMGKYIVNIVARENVSINDFPFVKQFLGRMRLSGTYIEQKLNKEFNIYYKTSKAAQAALGDAVELKVSKSITIKEAQ